MSNKCECGQNITIWVGKWAGDYDALEVCGDCAGELDLPADYFVRLKDNKILKTPNHP